MGWFWNKTSNSSSSTDPLRDLDPSLRDFLDKESPVKYKPAPTPEPSPPESTTSPHETTSPEKPLVPSHSLYPDGRYAHLWRNYRSLADIENETKSDQEKLGDVLAGYKARKAQIGRAAIENCAFEQILLDECFSSNDLKSTMTMCRKETRVFERCYTMQARFLKALGYLSTYERPPEIDEQIQMHADTLFHRMLAQEKAIADAKAAGEPEPTFAPILGPETPPIPQPLSQSPESTTPSTDTPTPNSTTTTAPDKDDLPTLSPTTQSLLNAAAQQKLRDKLKDMAPYERELEERGVQMEARTASDIAVQMKEVEAGRKKRREEGNGTAADTVAGWFGW